jgi:hypothetical protein
VNYYNARMGSNGREEDGEEAQREERGNEESM